MTCTGRSEAPWLKVETVIECPTECTLSPGQRAKHKITMTNLGSVSCRVWAETKRKKGGLTQYEVKGKKAALLQANRGATWKTEVHELGTGRRPVGTTFEAPPLVLPPNVGPEELPATDEIVVVPSRRANPKGPKEKVEKIVLYLKLVGNGA